MKTPRELLLARHQDAKAKLDTVRRGVVEGVVPATPAAQEPRANGSPGSTFFIRVWQELIWPSRRAWATIAIIWVGVLVWNVAENDTSPRSQGTSKEAKSQMVLNLAAQRHLLSELLQPAPLRPPEPARANTQPRTEVGPSFKFC